MKAKAMFRTVSLTIAILMALSLVLSSCATPAPVEPKVIVETVVVEKEVQVQVPAELPSKYSESPKLAEQVTAGKLPAVAERLPENPLVVLPVESIGEYGGTWHRGWRGVNDFHCFGRIIYETVLRWPRNPSDAIQPGLAEKWEWSADGKELTLYFRKGLKWSDGEPFSVDDVIFWWENIENDKNITKSVHAEWVVKGEPTEFEKIDDVTLKLKFAAPNGLAETVGLAFHGNQWPLGFERFGFFAPKHYLEKYHPAFTKDATYEVFEKMASEYNPERPAMTPWIITDWKEGADHMTATRNPYYWKVDVEGKQLPYIDEVYFYLVADNTAITTLALQGKIDSQDRGLSLSDYTVFVENAEAGDYRVYMWDVAQASGLTLFPNQSYNDPKYRELLQNLKFRQALSVSMDRDLINQVVFLNQGVPQTISVVKDSALYQPDIADQFAQFDPELAKTLIAEVGLKKGGNGFYTFADGSPLELVIETSYTSGSLLDGLTLIAEGWNKIGLKTRLETMSREVFWPKAGANEVMISVWTTDRGLVPMIDPIYQFPFDERSWMAPAFGIWYKSGGKDGQEPNAELKALMDLYDKYRLTVDPAEQLKLAKEIVRQTTLSLNVLQTVGMSPSPVVVKNNFHNVQKNHTSDWLIMTPGTQDPSHYWIEQK